MRLVSLASFQFLFVSANQKLTDKLNALIAQSTGGTYTGGGNKGVMVRTPDFFDGSPPTVVPATFWHNDIFAPSQIYPTVASPWCPFSGSDGFYDQGTCNDDPWKFAAVGYVMADSMYQMWDKFDDIQNEDWNQGVFYASDANAADKRCIYREDWGVYDCPGGSINIYDSTWNDEPWRKGSGGYNPGNPDVRGLDDGGGGAGCHFDDPGLIDQVDAYDSDGENLVQDYNCQCNWKAYRGRWYDWVGSFANNLQQKPAVQGRDWLCPGCAKAPAWGVDTAACWLSNPRDLIELQNALYWQRESWNNQRIPKSNWNPSSSVEMRKYWGWNEIPISGAVAQDVNSWDAILIKLPADICQDNYGANDDPSCLDSDALWQVEADLDVLVNSGKLVLGQGNMGKWGNQHPRSDIVFVKEVGMVWDQNDASGVNWSREFFCSNWVSPGNKYRVVSDHNGCYIDSAFPVAESTAAETVV